MQLVNMNNKFILKLIYMHIVFVYLILLSFYTWPLNMFEYRYANTLFIILAGIFIAFKCYGLLSDLVIRDNFYEDLKLNILELVKFSEYIHFFGIGIIVISSILFNQVSAWMAWLVTGTYIQYLMMHLYYFIYRKRVA